MSLADLIRPKTASVGVATAIFAIPATDGQEVGRTVAKVATVAVASPEIEKTEGETVARIATVAVASPRSEKPEEPTPAPETCWRWLVVLPDGTRWEVDTLPPATLEEMRERFPGAHLEMLEVAP